MHRLFHWLTVIAFIAVMAILFCGWLIANFFLLRTIADLLNNSEAAVAAVGHIHFQRREPWKVPMVRPILKSPG